MSEASGWDIVPPTVMRDGPFGEGMVQLWVEVDESVDLAELIGSDNPALRRIAVLDAVLNNADRKAGHLLPLPDGRIQGIDNGLCFAVEPKLRTVLWRWRGQPLTDEERAVLERLHDRIGGRSRRGAATAARPGRGGRHLAADRGAAVEWDIAAPGSGSTRRPLASVLKPESTRPAPRIAAPRRLALPLGRNGARALLASGTIGRGG